MAEVNTVDVWGVDELVEPIREKLLEQHAEIEKLKEELACANEEISELNTEAELTSQATDRLDEALEVAISLCGLLDEALGFDQPDDSVELYNLRRAREDTLQAIRTARAENDAT